jgi:hypothetical protein
VTANIGARWIAEDRGLYQDSGQDIDCAPTSQPTAACRCACPLYPLPEIAIIRASFWELYFELKRRTASC